MKCFKKKLPLQKLINPVYVLNVFPPDSYVEVLNPSTLECDSFGNGVFQEVVKLK